MTTIDELQSHLTRVAERGDHRSATVVYRAALATTDRMDNRPAPDHRPVRVLIAVTAALCLTGLAIGIAAWPRHRPTTVKAIDQPSPLTPSITVTGDASRQITGTFADSEPWSVRRDPEHGLCVVMAGVNLGCDDVGPVLPAGADPTTVRWGLDGVRWLAYAELPADAVGVMVRPRANQPPGGEPIVDREAGLWAVPGDNPDDLYDVGSGYTVQYRMADGRIVDAPRAG